MIAATIKGCGQVGVNEYQDWRQTYLFDESATIAEILERTGQTDICACNLSMVAEAGKREGS